jgi:hypothetical protein
MAKWSGVNDFGDAPHGWDSGSVKRGGVISFEDGQQVFTDGQGNKSWLQASACASANSIVLPGADLGVGLRYTVKRKDTTLNELKVRAISGNVEGTATYAIITQHHSFTFQSDGTNYYIISQYP